MASITLGGAAEEEIVVDCTWKMTTTECHKGGGRHDGGLVQAPPPVKVSVEISCSTAII